AEDGIRDKLVTGVQTCALPIYKYTHHLIMFVAPPPVRDAERSFPKLADHQNKKPARRKRAPIDELKRNSRTEKARHDAADRKKRSEERRVGKEWRPRWATYE